MRAITSRKDAGTRVADMFPSLRGRYDLAFADPADADLAAFATPAPRRVPLRLADVAATAIRWMPSSRMR